MKHKILFIVAGVLFCYTISIIDGVSAGNFLLLLFTILLSLSLSGFFYFYQLKTFYVFQEENKWQNIKTMLIVAVICLIALIILGSVSKNGDLFSIYLLG